HVAGIQLPLDVHLLAVLDLHHFLRRHQRLTDRPRLDGTLVLLDLPLDERADLVLVARRRLDGVPTVFHGDAHRASRDGMNFTSTPVSKRSMSVITSPRMSTKMMIAIVAWRTWGISGQVTLRISAITPW